MIYKAETVAAIRDILSTDALKNRLMEVQPRLSGRSLLVHSVYNLQAASS